MKGTFWFSLGNLKFTCVRFRKFLDYILKAEGVCLYSAVEKHWTKILKATAAILLP